MTNTTHHTLADLQDVVEAYRTCELATISKSGVPIAWPLVTVLSPDASSLLLTTSIAVPIKAFNIRRDPRVALLFSDPTGTGRTDLPQVLVRGTATCPDVIHTSPAGLETYWSRLWERQPESRGYKKVPVLRNLMDWYYMRLVITVTPQDVTVAPPLPQLDPLSAPAPAEDDHTPYAEAARRLPTYRSAVLGMVRGTAPPTLQRTTLTVDHEQRRLLIPSEHDETWTEGPASLLLHRHDDQLSKQTNFGLTGQLSRLDQGWAFDPERFVAGMDELGPLDTLRTMRRVSRTATQYLAKRDLPRPRIAWQEFKALDPAR